MKSCEIPNPHRHPHTPDSPVLRGGAETNRVTCGQMNSKLDHLLRIRSPSVSLRHLTEKPGNWKRETVSSSQSPGGDTSQEGRQALLTSLPRGALPSGAEADQPPIHPEAHPFPHFLGPKSLRDVLFFCWNPASPLQKQHALYRFTGSF